MSDFIESPGFSDRFEAAQWAISWAKENPDVYLTYGGPMYPVPCESFLGELRAQHGVDIKAIAGCEMYPHQVTVVAVVNALLDWPKAQEAHRCVSAWRKFEDYVADPWGIKTSVPHPLKNYVAPKSNTFATDTSSAMLTTTKETTT